MDGCIFCQIASGKTDTKLEKETQNVVVFKDIHPQAPVHLLIVPKKHIKDISEADDKVWNEVKDLAVHMSREKSLLGFRLITNAGDSAAISHMHVHFLGEVSADRAV